MNNMNDIGNNGNSDCQTRGKKIGAGEAANILHVTRGHLYNYINKNLLHRAEKPRRGLKHQPLKFFLKEVVALALEHERITPEEAAALLADQDEESIVPAA